MQLASKTNKTYKVTINNMERKRMTCMIIGLGQIGLTYDFQHNVNQAIYTHARAFYVSSYFNLLGAVDIDKEKQKLFNTNYNLPAFSDLNIGLKELDPDLVIVATKTESHLKVIKSILEIKKPKVILCEKPLAESLNDSIEIVELCKNNNIRLYVNYIRRADPGAIEVYNRINNNLIKGPFNGVAWYSKGLLNNGSHLINILEFWLGHVKGSSIISKGRLWNNEDPEPNFVMNFEHGNINFLAIPEENFSHYTIELIGANGILNYNRGGEDITWTNAIIDKDFEGYISLSKEAEHIKSDMRFYQRNIVNELFKAINEKENFICNGEEALETIKSIASLNI